MVYAIDSYFLQQEEPIKSCLQALRDMILQHDTAVTEVWRYGMPFYCYNGKRFCYLWVHKKYKQPYVGIVDGNRIDHPLLIAEKRSRMKIMLVDPTRDIPRSTLTKILKAAIIKEIVE